MQRIFCLALVGLFLLQGTLLACLNPSFQKIITTVPMACCAKVCQKKNSQEEAQTACRQTAFQENKTNGVTFTAQSSIRSPFVGLAPFSDQTSPSFSRIASPSISRDFQHRRHSPPIYLIAHAFLI